MASEDSDQIRPGLLAIHGLRDFRDLDEPAGLEMAARRDDRHAACELLEVVLLRGMHWMLLKERNYRSQQILTPSHGVPIHMLAMVVVTPVWHDLPDSEEIDQLVQARDALRALRHSKLVRDLKAGSVAAPALPVRLPDKAD